MLLGNATVDTITERPIDGRIYSIYELHNLTITNNNLEHLEFPGTTYLTLSIPQYGHLLHDIYAQWRMMEDMCGANIVLTNVAERGMFYGNGWLPKVMEDFLEITSYDKTKIIDISLHNYKFEKVVAIFDMCNLTPYFLHYLPFCNCYIGTDSCGRSEWFKYNEDAVKILRQDFGHLFKPNAHRKIYISRRRYEEEYKKQIEQGKDLSRAKMRYFGNEPLVESFFADKGYEIIHAQDFGLYEQIAMFSEASHIASISGTGLINLIWGSSHTTGIEISGIPGYRWHYDTFAGYANVGNYLKLDITGFDDTAILESLNIAIGKNN